MPSIPTLAPNYNNPRPMSAWWLENTGSSRAVVATTGWAFVHELQRKLKEYFSASNRPTLGRWNAYAGGRGDVPETTVTDLNNLSVDGNWGPKTNAALWIRMSEEKARVTNNPALAAAIQYAMDQIEHVQITHRINFETLRAAIWLVRYRMNSYQFALTNVSPGGTTEFQNSVVPPPYNGVPSAPVVSERDAFYSWDPDNQAQPVPTSGGVTTPQPGTGTGTTPQPTPGTPGPVPGTAPPVVAPPATTPVAAPRRILGMTTGQLLLGAAVLVGVGAVAYTMTQDDGKKKGKHKDEARSNPYDDMDEYAYRPSYRALPPPRGYHR